MSSRLLATSLHVAEPRRGRRQGGSAAARPRDSHASSFGSRHVQLSRSRSGTRTSTSGAVSGGGAPRCSASASSSQGGSGSAQRSLEDELAAQLPFVRDSARLSPEIKYSFCNILKKEGKLNYLAVHEHWAQNVPKLLGTDFKFTVRHAVKKDARTVVVRWTATWIAVDGDSLRQADSLMSLLSMIEIETGNSKSQEGGDAVASAALADKKSPLAPAASLPAGAVVADDELKALQDKLSAAEARLQEALSALDRGNSSGGWATPSPEAPARAVNSALAAVREVRVSLRDAQAKREKQKAEEAKAAKAAEEDRARAGAEAGGGAPAEGVAAAAMQESLLTIEQAKFRERFTCAARGQSVFTLDAEQRVVAHEDSIDWTWGEGQLGDRDRAARDALASPDADFRPSDTAWVFCVAFCPPGEPALLWQASVARQVLWETYLSDNSGGDLDEPLLTREEFDAAFNSAVLGFAVLQLVLFAGFFIYLPYWFIVVAPTLPQQFDEVLFRAGLTEAPELYDGLGTAAAAGAAAATAAASSSAAPSVAEAAQQAAAGAPPPDAAAAAAAASSAKALAAVSSAAATAGSAAATAGSAADGGAATALAATSAAAAAGGSALFGQQGVPEGSMWLIVLQSWLGQQLPPPQ